MSAHPHGLHAARERFAREMVAWIQARLAPPGVRIDAATPLFARGIINSIRILELIAWTERAIGRNIPDVQIRLDNFRTVERIAEVFVEEAAGDAAA
jgi:acyl carrier protein